MIDVTQLGLGANVGMFAGGALAVWLCGVRLVDVVDDIAERTGLGRAFAGLVLLAGATSLPELATTVAAALAGAPDLAVNNLLGGIATQTAILAVADATMATGALTWFAPRAALLVEANLLIVLLALAAAAILVGDPIAVGPVGLAPVLLFLGYLLALWLLRRQRGEDRWRPVEPPPPEPPRSPRDRPRRSLAATWGVFAAFSSVILAAGAVLAWSAEALAEHTGLGTSFVGASLLAGATSLPELSTTLAAVRLGAHAMAVSNILGSNMLMIAMLLPADLSSPSGPILRAIGPGSLLALLVGIAVTAIYVIGLAERRNRTILRMGYDSAAVVLVWAAGLVGLYLLG